jgi:two-component system alkaline phosphatase synthesis response regulator PhoP
MRKILVVDDDADFVDATRLVLESKGYLIEVANFPGEAMKALRENVYDLVVLDVMLPTGFEGFEIARAIREDLKLPKLPIIILSSVHEEKNVPYRFQPDENFLPVDVVLDKPIKPALLVETVERLLVDNR